MLGPAIEANGKISVLKSGSKRVMIVHMEDAL
jgi:hypothetical protein